MKDSTYIVAKVNSHKELNQIERQLRVAMIDFSIHKIFDRSTKPWGVDATIYVSTKRELLRAQAVLEGRFEKVFVVCDSLEYEGYSQPLGVFIDQKFADEYANKQRAENTNYNYHVFPMPILPLKIIRVTHKST